MMVEPWIMRAPAGVLAVETPSAGVSYGELVRLARAGAGELLAGGVGPGDRVALVAEPDVWFVVAFWACVLLGAVVVPVDPRLGARERGWLGAGVRVLIDSPLANAQNKAATAGGAPNGTPGRAPALDDPLMVVHTSGTTGVPRPVELTYGNVLANALGCAVALGHERDERWLCPLPLSHVGGLMVLLRSAVYATTAVIGPHDDAATLVSLVPTMLARVLDTPPPPRLRAVLLGGAPAGRALLIRARDAGWPVAPTYGLTQACSQVTVGEPGDVDTSGRALPGVHVQIAPDGEILVTGPTVAGGGTLHTGDLGRLDDRGRLIVTGRKADTIVTGGENVAPAEVEAALREHPAVADAGVFARPHPEWGEAVTARVVLRDGAQASAEELRAFAAERLARFKVPKTVELAEALPRTASGKLLRRELA
jgi:o-succinylbenzoate---CoA ligase